MKWNLSRYYVRHHSHTDLMNSAAAQQLRTGFRWLRFSDPLLERAFLQHHFERARLRVQVHLWLSIMLVIAVILIDDSVLNRQGGVSLLLVRGTALACLFTSVLIAARGTWYERYYPRVIVALLPVFAACVVLNDMVDKPAELSFFAAIILTVVGMYLLVGLLFFAALSAGLFVMAIYVVGALVTQVPQNQLVFNVTILLFTNIVAAAATYSLEKLIRTGFLEAQLLNDMANRDGLTGIYNRRAFDEHTRRVWQQAQREGRGLGLLLIDIDHFKAYNDYYGHQVGDQCLQQVAAILTAVVRRPMDFAARYGGEEFAVVLYEVTSEHVRQVAEQVQTRLQELGINHPASPVRRLTVSIGAARVVPEVKRTVYGCIQLADEALYEAKESGRDRVVIKDEEYATLSTGAFRHPQEQTQERA